MTYLLYSHLTDRQTDRFRQSAISSKKLLPWKELRMFYIHVTIRKLTDR